MTAVAKSLASKLSHYDHRLIGQRQKLFFFSEFSKGSCFFQPRGAYIYNKLLDFLRNEYIKRNYQEVITPNVFDSRLWQKSGHWEHYKEHMIKFKDDDMSEHDFSLKPMNCPGHCLMFKNLGASETTTVSTGNNDNNTIGDYMLPIRLADFGVLHRNEPSGTLLGLSRVRRFQQDDAHIFCTPEQVESEVRGCLEFAKYVYDEFEFKFDISLSLRPEKYMGDTKLWEHAEESLRQALKSSELTFEEQPNEGAFYGPKIDLIIKDCHERSQQCATIQLDFQLPQRFELSYRDPLTRKPERPVMIHRAILGSLERFIAMLAEHTCGRWPFWLSPLQAQIIPISDKEHDYARNIERQLKEARFMVDCSMEPGLKVNKRIHRAETTRYNFIIIVGQRESEDNTVTVRVTVDKKVHQRTLPFVELVKMFTRFRDERIKHTDRQLLESVVESKV